MLCLNRGDTISEIRFQILKFREQAMYPNYFIFVYIYPRFTPNLLTKLDMYKGIS